MKASVLQFAPIALVTGFALAAAFTAPSPAHAAAPMLARSVSVALHAAATPDPAQQASEAIRLLRQNDLAGLVRTALPPSEYAKEIGRAHV